MTYSVTDGGDDAAEPNEWDKFQDFGHSHWHNSLIVEVSYLKDDVRPAFVLADVNGADFHHVKAQRATCARIT